MTLTEALDMCKAWFKNGSLGKSAKLSDTHWWCFEHGGYQFTLAMAEAESLRDDQLAAAQLYIVKEDAEKQPGLPAMSTMHLLAEWRRPSLFLKPAKVFGKEIAKAVLWETLR